MEVKTAAEMEVDAEIERLPLDLLAYIFTLISSFRDLAQASGVSRRWRRGVEESLARRHRLSFAGWKMDDDSTARLVRAAYSLKELDISRSCWGCQITDEGLFKISSAKCVGSLTSISLWGMAGITDKGVVQLLKNTDINPAVRFVDGPKRDTWVATHVTPRANAVYHIRVGNLCEYMQVSRASSLQHLNIGGTFITDESLFAIANSCPQLKTIVLWSCRHVTEHGLFVLVNECRKLESINVWGMRVPVTCFISLLTVSPALRIKPDSLHVNAGSVWPVAT